MVSAATYNDTSQTFTLNYILNHALHLSNRTSPFGGPTGTWNSSSLLPTQTLNNLPWLMVLWSLPIGALCCWERKFTFLEHPLWTLTTVRYKYYPYFIEKEAEVHCLLPHAWSFNKCSGLCFQSTSRILVHHTHLKHNYLVSSNHHLLLWLLQ